jgi:hypothetical protein
MNCVSSLIYSYQAGRVVSKNGAHVPGYCGGLLLKRQRNWSSNGRKETKQGSRLSLRSPFYFPRSPTYVLIQWIESELISIADFYSGNVDKS